VLLTADFQGDEITLQLDELRLDDLAVAGGPFE
jgi:hypothetical protein